jgi:hypothetical protein
MARLKEADQKASHEHLMELCQAIQENKALNTTLSDKLGAYQRKIQRIQTEKQIATNQKNKRTFDEMLPEIQLQRQLSFLARSAVFVGCIFVLEGRSFRHRELDVCD